MAQTFDASDCELLSWRDALGGVRKIARARLFEGGAPVPARPLLWPSPLEEIEKPHLTDETAREADVIVVADALVGGPGGQPFKDKAYIYASAAYPGYVKFWLDQAITPERWAFDPGRLSKKRVERAFGLLHFNLIWGHWLTEMFPKLFAIRAMGERGLRAPIVLPTTAPDYVFHIIQDVLPGQELVVFDPETEYAAVRQLILPPMLQHFYVFHPYLGEALDTYAAPAPAPQARGRVFVSRGGMRTTYAYREMTNEAEIEAAASDLGFDVVRPETLPWREQLALFAGAGIIAGEFGSGLHNTLFSPRGAKVV
ncbi:MAG: glycosyltransferase 61 family protein, partial [Pseudomonadota bacterium]|nr:glycosyltransferase 61 family protein [Pseudomonadota bacterium]